MKISRNWLQTFFDAPLPDVRTLSDALTFHAFEIESIENVRLTKSNIEDAVLDVKVTPNRGHDCLSHRGIAKELSAILGIPLAADPLAADPRVVLGTIPRTTLGMKVTIENPILCSRYIAGLIRGVKIGPSPDWLRESLEAIGQKSINNVVDAANFVMLNIGQPMHVFDCQRLTLTAESRRTNAEDRRTFDPKIKIQIRNARKDEKITTLDDKEYELSESTLVIADGNSGKPIAIAGVKGGKSAEVTEATTDIILEAANFNGVSVRKTARALQLRTEAAVRFEQGISAELAAFGMKNCADLILKIACGTIEGFVEQYPEKQKEKEVAITVYQINRILGMELKDGEIAAAFTRLGFAFKQASEKFTVSPPFERLDLAIPEDLAEEVGRIIGYEKIPETELSAMPAPPPINKNFYTAEDVREKLISQGYSEVYTSVFSDKGERAVLNKAGGERPYLRADLIDGLKQAVEKNLPNEDILGIKEVKLFEIGTVWKMGGEEIVVGIADENESSQIPLNKYSSELPEPEHYEDHPLASPERYKPFSRFPFIVRDIALWVPAITREADVEKLVKENAGDLLVRAQLFDRFKKETRLSLAFRLIFQSFERTLTDAEANAIMENIYAEAKKAGWEVR